MNKEKEKELIRQLLMSPENLLQKKPFLRGSSSCVTEDSISETEAQINQTIRATLPTTSYHVVSQGQFLKELDPNSHKVLFDQNIPSITMKTNKGGYIEIEYQRMAIPFQKNIKNKQTLHLTGYPMQFTLMNIKPTEKDKLNFTIFKQYWSQRNQDGMKTKMVDAQLSMGDAGLLYYFDSKGQIKSRLLCYKDGYVLCPHNDDNGDRILESVYYVNDDGVETIDSYDDKYMYRYTNDGASTNDDDSHNLWILHEPKVHGFSEIPLITKRGNVAWNDVQSLIEVYEVIYNIFMVIQKRHGWGILYIKGKFNDDGRKIAGAIVLNDRSMDGKGSAEFKTPPSPQGTIETLDKLKENIEIGSSTTFLLPKDVKSNGDISALAIMLTQSLDIENATQNVIEWQNVANKMQRLFIEGLAKELVNKGENLNAVTELNRLQINSQFKVWRPQNNYEYNQMLEALKGAGGISRKTLIEKNTESTPDEAERIALEEEEANRLQNSIEQNNTNQNINNQNNQ